MDNDQTKSGMGKRLLAGLLAYLLVCQPLLVFALPSGGEIVSGTGAIEQASTQDLVIQQDSQQMITNWQGFSIGSAESVTFQQPNASAVALNRVIGADPSIILGKLSANGQVFLTNPSGVVFGNGAVVDVNGFLATTLNITNEDFLNGQYRFFQDPNQSLSSIINNGLINASRYVGLLAPAVANNGSIIVADLGSVALASGTAATLDFNGDGLISFAVTGEVSGVVTDAEGNVLEDRINNSGLIRANGGQVLLTAKDAGDVIGNVVNHTGIIEAQTVMEKDGRIILSGGPSGVVNVSGVLDASGDDEGETGGTVQVTGEKVGLFETALLDVSGYSGGGTALIGGDYQGGGDVPTAQATYIGEGASIDADATVSGDGGKVIVWSDEITRVYGNISARGGSEGGNGGFVETSGLQGLEILTTPDISASNGEGGTWLIDPNNITIVAGAGAANINTTDPFVTTDDGAQLGVDLIVAALLGGNTVTLTTSTGGSNLENGDIFFNADLDYDGITSGTLNLQADGDIIFNSSIFDGDTLSLDTLSLSLQTGTNGVFRVQTSQSIVTNGEFNFGLNDGFIDIIAGDVDLLGTLDSGTAFTQIQTTGTVGLGDANCGGVCALTLSGGEIQNITTASLLLGGSSTSGIFIDNLTALNTQNIIKFSLTSTGDIDFVNNSSVFSGRLDLVAGDNINVNTMVETLGSGGLGLTALTDFDSDGTGNLVVGATGSVLTNNTNLSFLVNDIDLNPSGSLDAGTGTITLQFRGGGAIGVSGTGSDPCSGACTVVLLGTELQRMTAGQLTLGGFSTGNIFIADVTGTQTANLGAVVLGALQNGSQVTFTGDSTFNALGVFADSGINVNGDLTTQVGNLVLNGDFDGADDGFGFDSISLANAITLSAGDGLDLIAATGGINSAGPVTFNSGGVMIIESNFAIGGTPDVSTFTADSDNNGTGDFSLLAGATISSPGGTLDIFGANIDLQGVLDAGTGSISLLARFGSILDDNLATTSIIADVIDLSAFSNIGESGNFLDLDANTLSAKTTSPASGSSIFIKDIDEVMLEQFSTVNGSIAIMIVDDMTIITGTLNSGSESTTLTSETGSIEDDGSAGTSIIAGDLTLSAATNIGTSTNPLDVNADTLTASSDGDIVVDEDDNITLTDVSSTSGSVDVSASGIITTQTVSAGSGTITLSDNSEVIEDTSVLLINDLIDNSSTDGC